MKIEVVLPVINYNLALALLEQIDANTVTPDRVLVVDNTNRTHPWMLTNNFDLDFLYTTTGRLNESWEVARKELHEDTDLVFFLNDDLIIGSWFFERMLNTVAYNDKYGVVCARTVTSPDSVKKGRVQFREERGAKFDAWAFGIKKELLDTIPPIPWDRITTFCGDLFVWEFVKRKGLVCGKDLGNNMYHYVGTSILKLGFRILKRVEHNEWVKIHKEMWGD